MKSRRSTGRGIICLALAAMLFAGGCVKDDIKELRDDLSKQDARITTLAQQQTTANSQIQSLQTLIAALQANKFVKSVTQLANGNGYEITFSDDSKATIENGASPVIGVKEAGGVFYWAVNNEFITEGGNKIPVTGAQGISGTNAVAPQVRIDDDGFWQLSTDGGTAWSDLLVSGDKVAATGDAGDAYFQSVTETDDYVTFVLTGGGTIQLPKYKTFGITFTGVDDYLVGIIKNTQRVVEYQETGGVLAVGIASAVPSGWTVSIDKSNKKITITAPNSAAEAEVLIVATGEKGVSASYWLSLRSIDNVIDAGAISAAIAAGGTLELLAGVEYEIADGLDFSQDITIKGGEGATLKAESPAAQGLATGNNPALYITNNAVVTLEDLTITSTATGAAAVDGITLNGGTLTLKNVTFDGIWNGDFGGMQHGRAITVIDGELTVEDCTFKNFNKNGIHVLNGTADITGCTFEGNNGAANAAAQNGVVFLYNATGSVTNCNFTKFKWEHTAIDCDHDAWSIGILLYWVPDETQVACSGNTFGNDVSTGNDCNYNWFEDDGSLDGIEHYIIGANTWSCKPAPHIVQTGVTCTVEAESCLEGLEAKQQPWWAESGQMFGSNYYIQTNSSVTYPVKVNNAGNYDFQFALANWGGTTFVLYIDDNAVSGSVSIPQSDGVTTTYINVESVSLTPGNHTVKVTFSDWIDFDKFLIE